MENTITIKTTAKRVTVHVPDYADYYGIARRGHTLYFDKADVAASLKRDGWASLDEIDNSGTITAADWLQERCKPVSRRWDK